MSFDELKNRLSNARVKNARSVARASWWIKGAAVLGGAAIAGICQFTTWGSGTPSSSSILGIAACVVVFAGGIYVLATEQDAAQAIEVADSAVEEVRAASARFDELDEFFEAYGRLIEIYQICLSMRGGIEQAVIGSPNIDQLVVTLFDLVSRQISIAAGFQQADRWTIGVYKAVPSANPDRADLKCIAQERALKCELYEARMWPEGVGIAGIAYSNAREIVLPDLQAEGMQGVFGPKGHQRTYDAERYVSMVAVPIQVAGHAKPWGVVTATSDRAGHFAAASNPGIKTDEPIRAVAAFIGLAVAMWDGIQRTHTPVALVGRP
ncbi:MULTISPECIES: hypothetical protein [unclassified Sphingomonas]|uniref:hypothetical protein n=1 Tax=unclassified Sphingomonas TaxID=196159 RepID=UPI000A7123BD|nr:MULTISPECIES: hypothetical protein [unclassified Sphingomonas]